MYTLLSVPFNRHFRASVCSQATAFGIVLAAVTVIIPYVVAILSQSFWLKENSFREQPSVLYTHALLLYVEGQTHSPSNLVQTQQLSLFFSTDPGMNSLFEDGVRAVASIKTAERDYDRDGMADALHFSVLVPLLDQDDVMRVRIVFLLQYELMTVCRLSMQSLAIIDEGTTLPAQSLYLDGDLRLTQRRILSAGVDDITYDRPAVNFSVATSGPDTMSLSWNRILGAYADRDVRTEVNLARPSWTHGRGSGQPLNITGRIRYPEDRVFYRPGPFEVVKFAWVQYLALLAIVGFITGSMFHWAVKYQIVPTHVIVDGMPRAVGRAGVFKPQAF
ncbi:hypothetical protein HK101_002345 [Irineochytrium annulatum]|nr:hypothetical protein HK101_002345 [Irineochytrium annulatum]